MAHAVFVWAIRIFMYMKITHILHNSTHINDVMLASYEMRGIALNRSYISGTIKNAI